MADVAVTTQLQQWTFEKPSVVRPERSDSSASSPDLYHNDLETLRIDTAAVDDSTNPDSKESLSFHERYLSSEEDLSPMEGGSDSEYDDDISIHDVKTECFSARKMSISRWDKGKSCDMAITVSYVSAGRPKMIDLANIIPPFHEPPPRAASLAGLPIAALNRLQKADQASRMSLSVSSSTSRSVSPASASEPRRPSTGHVPFSHNNSLLHISDSYSSLTDSTTRSSSVSIPDSSLRPATAASAPQPRSSIYVPSSQNRGGSPLVPFPPLTPQSPEPHSFLSSDPYETSTTSSASPIIKAAPHKRLRSISQKLSLAKIAISPIKKWDSRINGKGGNMPPTPATPYSPMTPQTAPPTTTFPSPKKSLRRSSRISRPSSVRGPSPEMPPVPILAANPQPRNSVQRLVARGAGEREPILELPPCPDENVDPMGSIKSRRVRKRKSLMDLL